MSGKHTDNHSSCQDCGVLLARSYPYEYCPKCWTRRYNAPPGECRIDQFEAATKRATGPMPQDIPPSFDIQRACKQSR